MNYCKSVFDFFNNQSVGAFLGALAAYGLVAFNDSRRERRKVKNVWAEVEVNLDHAEAKLTMVRQNIELFNEQSQVMIAQFLPFNTAFFRQLSAEVRDNLSHDQRRSIDALCLIMEATDSKLEEVYGSARQLSDVLGQADRVMVSNLLHQDLKIAAANLNRFIKMSKDFIAGRFAEILTAQYDLDGSAQ